LKGGLCPDTFIKRCQHISKHFGGNGSDYPEVWPDSNSCTYSDYVYRANKKELKFDLTKEDFTEYVNDNCYYCGKEKSDTHINGIDRVDNEQGYTYENCVTACSQCNYMKGSLSYVEFIETCKKITDHVLTNEVIIPQVKKSMKAITKREKVDVPKVPIHIEKIQPRKEKPVTPPAPVHVPKIRVYTRGVNLPEDCPIKPEDIPEYCSYVKATEKRGDAFCVNKAHPKQRESGKEWKTTASGKFGTEEKFKMLMDYLNAE
jgi:hypothetical protein